MSEAQDFHELIRVTVVAGGERVAVAGTGIGPGRVPHLVEVQGRRLTIELERFVTVFRYADLPGMLGRVGTIFGKHGINIARMGLGRKPGSGRAVMLIEIDNEPPPAVLEELPRIPGVREARFLKLG